MLQYQVMGIVIISALILIVMIFAILEMHSNRIANIMMDSANLADSNVIVTHNANNYGVSTKSEDIPDMSENCDALFQSNDDVINAIIKVSYEPKTNHIMVDSSVMVRFMICMFLLKFQQVDRRGMFKALAMWVMNKLTLDPEGKV